MAASTAGTGRTGSTGGRNAGSFLDRLSTETKQAFKTTEFWVMVAVLIALLIAGNSVEGKDGGADYFAADKVWLYVTLLAIGYMVSRGLAKSGSREPYYADRDGRDLGNSGARDR